MPTPEQITAALNETLTSEQLALMTAPGIQPRRIPDLVDVIEELAVRLHLAEAAIEGHTAMCHDDEAAVERLTVERNQAHARVEFVGFAVAIADDILQHFTERGHPGYSAMRTGWIKIATVARWRTTLAPLRALVAASAREATAERPHADAPGAAGASEGKRVGDQPDGAQRSAQRVDPLGLAARLTGERQRGADR